MKTAEQILKQSAEIFAERQKTYKDNWRTVGKALHALYPQGLYLESEEDFTRFQFVMLQMVKMSRYSQNFKEGGHSDSALDLITYTAMLEQSDQEEEELRKSTVERNDIIKKMVFPETPSVKEEVEDF
jgi:hypothetical protein